ncbi:VWA domain-containing protein [Myxococcota bacterium]|nr:VWA domain-containing protein [Myxococcota bacterium]
MNIESFHFLRPAWLLTALGLVPMFWLIRRQNQTAGAWQSLCDAPLLRRLMVDAGSRASRWPVALVTLGWLCTSIALAGPTWERLPQPTFQAPSHTALVLDLSRSMVARDVTPSRLARARFEMLDLLGRIDGAVGLVIYAEEPYSVTPLTDDPNVIANLVPTLEPQLMPGRGDRLDRGIDEAHQLLTRVGATTGRIVVIGDGLGERPELALAAAERAADAGFRLGVLGVGGNAADLQRLANAGDGVFAPHSADDRDLEAVLSVRATPLTMAEALEETGLQTDLWRDAGAWLVVVPLLLAPFAFRRGWAGALGLAFALNLGAPSARAAATDDWWETRDQRGAAAFEEGNHARAAELFENEAWRASAQYRAGDYASAVESLQKIEGPRASYNLGNALARSGQLEQALAAYDEVLKSEPEHEDAQHNRELVEKLLEQQQQEQSQQQQQQSPSGGSNDEPSQPESGAGTSDTGDSESRGSQSGDSEATPSEAANQDGSEDSTASHATDAPSHDPNDAGQSASAGDSEIGSGTEEQPSDVPSTSEGTGGDDEGHASPPDTGGSPADTQRAAGGSSQPEAQRAESDTSAPNSPQEAPPGSSRGHAPREFTEHDQEIEQWLNRVPDDPGGLLREKLRRRYAQKRYSVR